MKGPAMRTWVMLAAMMGVMLLGGCMAVRAPMLKTLATKNSPVPEGGKVIEVKVQPLLPIIPVTSFDDGRYTWVKVHIHAPGSPQGLVAFYREELGQRGWRENKQPNGHPAPDGVYYFERGDEMMKRELHYESLRLELRDAGDGAMDVSLTIGQMSLIDMPGFILRGWNDSCGVGVYYATHSETAAKVAAWPGALIIATLF